ncbi:MAG: diguanylate cyclase [Halomonadaceae bacterium]|nr:MAG: diguanylate cyclase [Halomonadaceae bacterium]
MATPGAGGMMTRVFLLCLLLPLATMGVAEGHAEPLRLSPGHDMIQLGTYVEYLEDRKGTLSIESLIGQQFPWQVSGSDALNFGYSASAYWVRFSLALEPEKNPQALPYVLEIAYPVLDQVDAYVMQDGERIAHFAMGDQLPFTQRPIAHPSFAIPLDVHPSGLTEIYLRVQSSSSVQIPLNLYSNQKMVERSYETALAQALFYGAMLVMAMYNLLIFFSIRDVSHLYYVMMVVSTVTLLAGIDGLTFKYLWPQVTWLNDPILVVSLAGIVAFSALFFRSFLHLPQSRPMHSRLALGLIIAAAVMACGAFFLPYRPLMLITTLLAMGGIVIGVTAGILRWRDGFHGARLFNIAWGCMLVAGFLLALTNLGFLPRNWFSGHILQIGAGLQAVLLSFAMAHRISYEKRMGEEARQEAAATQQQMLEHQMEATRDLDRIVRERTEELEKTNAKLKEISATDGLTHLLNRRAFDEIFLTEYKRAYRDKHPIAVVMIDLDHFKNVNDNYGHPFGDLCLVRAAEVLLANLRRPSDIAARYGGEEFILLLPDTDAQGGVCVAQNILQGLAQTVMDDGEKNLVISASIGVAARIPHKQNDHETLLNESDQHLYRAKAGGRNRIEWQHD